jgi:hypothetical protein
MSNAQSGHKHEPDEDQAANREQAKLGQDKSKPAGDGDAQRQSGKA